MPETLLLAASLIGLTFVFEDSAMLLGAEYVAQGRLDMTFTVVLLLVTVFVSDLTVYALGAAGRRWSPVERWLPMRQVDQFGRWLDGRLGTAIILSRVLPWMLPPTFLACGFTRVPLRHFMIWSGTTGSIWTLAMFFGYSSIIGERSRDGAYEVVEIAIFAAVLLFLGWRSGILGSMWYWLRGKRPAARSHHQPAPDAAWFAALPAWVIYLPMSVCWILLAMRYRSATLPTAANPGIEAGGLLFESKSKLFGSWNGAARDALLDTLLVAPDTRDAQAVLMQLGLRGMGFALIAKPDRGEQGYGVAKIDDLAALQRYLDRFPAGHALILQTFCTLPIEAGIFFERAPDRQSGRIVSLALSQPVGVTGDGERPIEDLVHASVPPVAARRLIGELAMETRQRVPAQGEWVELVTARSFDLGARLTDARGLVTRELREWTETVASCIPGFHHGRFDVRAASIEDLMAGRGIRIMELNGAGADAIHIWDRDASLIGSWLATTRQLNHAFLCGHQARLQGHRPIGLPALFERLRASRQLYRALDAARLSGEFSPSLAPAA